MIFHKIQKLLLLIHCLLISPMLRADINRDLELDALFSIINHTQTTQGYKALQNLLAHPINNLEVLRNRQTVITDLIENDNLQKKLTSLLQTLHSHEPHFEHMLQQASAIETAALEEFYFSHPSFKEWNYSPACLELGQVAYLGNLCSSLAQHSLAYAVFTLGLSEEHTCAVHPPKKHHDKHKHHDDHKHHDKHKDHDTCKHHDHHKGHDHATCSHHHHHTSNQLLQNLKLCAQSPQVRYAFHVWHIVSQLQEIYSIQSIVRNHLNCIVEIQTQLMGIAHGMHVLENIHQELEKHPEITAYLTHYQNLENVCLSTNISHKLQNLLKLLTTNTFKGKASPFSRIGIVLAAYKLIQEIGYELQPALDAIGELDAYVSCAQLFKNHQNSHLKYSFAHYTVDSTQPQLNAHNFWHPLATNDCITLNSLSLGVNNNEPQHIILTGPNACGKSTNLKALTLCAYLAQTITIVPAQEYSQTIYKEIYSSMTVSDDIMNNKSLFVCELTNAESLLEKVENLQSDEYMLITLDELFKSTHHKKGQEIAQRLLEKLYMHPQVITLVSTHFEQLTTLSEAHKDIAANYTVDQFLLKPGIGLSSDAFNIVNKQVKSRLMR